jgi:uncharacterized cupin superfamily protein
MDKLITVIPPDKVTDEYKEEAKKWPKWDSKNKKKFPFNYAAEERVLILEGSAELTPDDGSAVVVIGKGDSVTFQKGFKCKWKVTKRMKKHYTTVVDEDAPDPPAIVCDVCDQGCVEESYFMAEEEQDICPACFEKDTDKYPGAEHQKEGEKWVVESSSEPSVEKDEEEKPKKKLKTKK